MMDRKLYNAATEGNINHLLILLNEHPTILQTSSCFGIYGENPLHIAAILNHLEFATEILNRNPSFASNTDARKSTPLHLAAGAGSVEMVQLLLNATSPEMRFAGDEYGRNPVHVAGMHGRIHVLRWLLLQVGHDEVDDVVNSVDRDGNTVLHLAVVHQLLEVVNFLLQSTSIRVNEENLQGQTALDILLHMKLEGDLIGQALLQAGASSTKLFAASSASSSCPCQTRKTKKGEETDKFVNGTMKAGMVVASVIAAATFQAGINPPGGVWQDSSGDHSAGLSILAHQNKGHYNSFLIYNTIAFLASVTVFVLPLAKVPMSRRGYWWPVAFMWVSCMMFAVVFLGFSYTFSISAVSPPNDRLTTQLTIAVFSTVFLWSFVFLLRGLTKLFHQCSTKNRVIDGMLLKS